MEEEKAEAMLRQLIGHFQELYDLFVSNHTTPFLFSSPSTIHLYRRQLHHHNHLLLHPSTRSGINEDAKLIVKVADEHDKLRLAKKSRGERNCGKQTGQANSSEVTDQDIWKDLPEDLWEAVMAKLPIPTFLQFRLVCRKWYSLPSSRSFAQLCAEVSQPKPWFYAVIYHTVPSNIVDFGVIYDPSDKKWRHPPLPSLPPRVFLTPIASAGGLVCLLDFSHKYFYVCNPLTKNWKELPPRRVKNRCQVAAGMVLKGKTATEGYNILWVNSNGDFEVYDSIANCWTRPGDMPENIKLPLRVNIRSPAVSSKSSIYFMRSDPEGIVSYDMVSGVWKQFAVPVPLHSSDHTLAVCGDRIMLAGLLKRNAVTCVCVWELQKMMLLWKEVDRMPNIWCLDFYGKHVRMKCLGNKDLLMMSLRCTSETEPSLRNLIVSYEVPKKEWLKVPPCAFPRTREPLPQDIVCGTEFFPCLTAIP